MVTGGGSIDGDGSGGGSGCGWWWVIVVVGVGSDGGRWEYGNFALSFMNWN